MADWMSGVAGGLQGLTDFLMTRYDWRERERDRQREEELDRQRRDEALRSLGFEESRVGLQQQQVGVAERAEERAGREEKFRQLESALPYMEPGVGLPGGIPEPFRGTPLEQAFATRPTGIESQPPQRGWSPGQALPPVPSETFYQGTVPERIALGQEARQRTPEEESQIRREEAIAISKGELPQRLRLAQEQNLPYMGYRDVSQRNTLFNAGFSQYMRTHPLEAMTDPDATQAAATAAGNARVQELLGAATPEPTTGAPLDAVIRLFEKEVGGWDAALKEAQTEKGRQGIRLLGHDPEEFILRLRYLRLQSLAGGQ